MAEYFSKLAGVTFANEGSNRENRQSIISNLAKRGQLKPGVELTLKPEPQNRYDSNAVAVFAPDGRQLGYLAKDQAYQVSRNMKQGTTYKCFVSAVTGGGVGIAYGINVKIQSYEVNTTVSHHTHKDYHELKNGDVVEFGQYYISNSDKLEPLEWEIIATKEDSFLLLSKYIIDAKAWDNPTQQEILSRTQKLVKENPQYDLQTVFRLSTHTTWSDSIIRNWLNTAFFNIGF